MNRLHPALYGVLALSVAVVSADVISAAATIVWAPASTGLPATGIVRDVAFGDVNHDARPDLVVAFTGGPGLAVYGGNGAGVWSTTGYTTGLPATGSYEQLALGDIFPDGNLDVFASRGPNAGLAVWRGDGAGSWAANSTGLTTTGTYRGVALGDVNRDGRPDLIAAGDTAGVRVYRNNIASYTPITNPIESGAFNQVAVGYVNDDAYLDLAATGHNGIYFWKGAINSSWTLTRTTLPTSPEFRGLALGDVDNDSRPELIAARGGFPASGGGGIFIYEWDPTWSFSKGRWVLAANQISTTKSYARIDLRDINNDGWLDVVAAGTPTESGPGIAVWLSGPFGYTAAASPAVTTTLGSLSLADFDLDGLADVAAGDANGGGAWAWRSSGVQGALDTWRELPSPQPKGSPFAVGHGDLNRDGWLDVVLPGFYGGLEGWTGDGGNRWPTDSYCSGLNKTVNDGAYGDIVMDVFPDIGPDPSIIAARTDGGGLLFVTGVNCAGGADVTAITGSGSYGALSAGDLLRNGALDVVSAPAGAGAGLKIWYRSGAAWNSSSIAPGYTISDTALGDMDHDGELEIVVAETANGGVAVYDYNHGWVRRVVTETRTYYAVAVGDLDNDGNLDIVGGKNGADTGLDVWFGDSSLTNWKRQNGPDNGSQYYTVDLADFNHDGHLDLLAATEDRGVRLWAGDGAGGWTTANSGLPTSGLFYSARFGHIDHDGNLDILATGFDAGLRLWTAADGAAPTVDPFRPSLWISATQNPTLTAHMLDSGAGISVTSGQYRYSTNAGVSWSGWFAASISGENGSTAQQVMTATAVPFGQDSNAVTHDRNKIEFRAADMSGNVGSATDTIWIDTVPPPAPSYFASESHTAGGWSTNKTITVTFAGVDDLTSGWVGSSVVIDHATNTLPPAHDNATSGHYTAGPLADGLWYAHMRARDDAGNWGTVAGHIGPFGIDTVAPANPTVLYSSDHDPGVWSNDMSITMNWSGATDAGSGVRGYSYVMDTSPTTLPDAITETLGTTATIAKGTGNNHYFHIRTRDNVGNWSATAVHSGPYYIDTVPPASSASSPASVNSTSFTVSWTGSDANSGVESYDIQSRDKSIGGAWTDWKLAQTGPNASFTGTGGHIYEFRSRARDHAGNLETYPSYADATTEVATADLFIRTPGIEVNQSSQDLSNSVLLIRSKRTFVRCYAQSDSGTFTGVKARLKFYSNGVYQALLYPMNPGGTITVTTSPQRSQLNDAFLFDVPASYMKLGNATFECEINYPARKYAENDYGNNLASVTLNVNPAGVLNLNMVDVRYYYGGVLRTIRDEDRWRLEAWLEAAYPIQWVNPTWSYLNPPYDAIPEASTVLSDLDDNISDVDEALAMHHYGMAFQVDDFTFMRGLGRIGGLVAAGPTGAGRWWEQDDSFGDWYGGHELSHNLWLHHILCAGDEPNPVDYPYPGGQISPGTSPWALDTVYGIDGSVSPPHLYPPNTGDIRSYCEPIWVGPLTYQWIWPITSWASQESAQAPAAVPVERLSVHGTVVTPTDVVTLSAFYPVTSATDRPGRDISGTYSIRFFDAGGALLQNYAFSPTWEEYPGQQGGISERPPWVIGTTQIAIWHNETALVTRTVSAHAPTVSMDSPVGGETFGGATLDVAWTGNDVDPGDTLTYRLDYSRDGGATWQGISPSLHHPTATLDLSILPGTTQGKLRVTASDGVRTAAAATDGVFTVTDKTPEIIHLEPVSGTVYIEGQTVTFRGGAFDPDDNVLSGDHLTWTSSLMGTLGTGTLLQRIDLVVGTHLITLTATDSQGHAVSQSAVIIIQANDDEHVAFLPMVFKQNTAP